jgi:hypothetical protein
VSAFVQLLRRLEPGEERIMRTVPIPDGTRAIVTDEVCGALVDEMRAHLVASPEVGEIVYGPKILREMNRQDGRAVLIVTAFAIVRRAELAQEHRLAP